MMVQDILVNLDQLEQEDKVRDFDFYEGQADEESAAYEDGFIWVDEIDKWVQVSIS